MGHPARLRQYVRPDGTLYFAKHDPIRFTGIASDGVIRAGVYGYIRAAGSVVGDLFYLKLGYAQITALLVLAQRLLEELYSRRNTAKLIAAGAKEYGRDYYLVVAVTHLAWIAAIFFLIPSKVAPTWQFIWIYL